MILAFSERSILLLPPLILKASRPLSHGLALRKTKRADEPAVLRDFGLTFVSTVTPLTCCVPRESQSSRIDFGDKLCTLVVSLELYMLINSNIRSSSHSSGRFGKIISSGSRGDPALRVFSVNLTRLKRAPSYRHRIVGLRFTWAARFVPYRLDMTSAPLYSLGQNDLPCVATDQRRFDAWWTVKSDRVVVPNP